MYGNLPDLSYLRVFGSLAYASTLTNSRTKLDPRARKTAFLGFKLGTKGFRLIDLKSKEIFISRNVTFYETHFPFLHSTSTDISVVPIRTPQCIDLFQYDTPSTHHLQSPTHITLTDSNEHFSSSMHSPISSHTIAPITTPHTNNAPASQHSDITHDCITRKSERVKKPPAYLKDYHCMTTHTAHSSNVANSNSLYPISQHLSYDKLTPKYKSLSLAITSNQEPSTYEEAAAHECWRKAIQDELTALDQNRTWCLTELPKDKKAVGCKWVFRVKFNPDGTIERHKARLVAKGFTQVQGVDYGDTFSPVVKMTTLRVMLALAAAKKWHLKQLDVNTAFLHGDLDKEVYMKIPPGLAVSQPGLVCKL